MNREIIAEGAIRPEQAIGKPLVVYIDGERRQIGTITAAKLDNGKLFFAAVLDQEDE